MSETTRPLHSRPVTGLSVGCGTAVLLTSLTASAALAAVQPSGPPQKEARDVVVVRGCVESGTLTSIASADGDAPGDAAPGLTYRIAGPRALSKQLRREHEGHTEEITGRIKGEQAPRSTVRTKQMGKIGVVVGAAPGGAGPNAPRVPEMPSIEVEAFKHLENYCSPR